MRLPARRPSQSPPPGTPPSAAVLAMQHAAAACGSWHVESWEEPSGTTGSQDAKLVWADHTAGRLRVAAIDGVTPSVRCRTVVGVDGAMYAAAIVRLALQRAGSALEACVLAANRHLHDPRLGRSRDQTQACVTAADIFDDGRVEVVRAGDCEAWARTDHGWVELGTGSALTADVARRWADWRRSHPMVDRDARHDAEERFFGRPAAWTSTALGRFARPVLQHFNADGVQELVLASDGARLSEPVLADLPSWLGELRDWEARRADRGRAAEKLRDDVTVLRLRSLEPAASSSRWGREAPADVRRAA